MKGLDDLMKQAQEMQKKMQEQMEKNREKQKLAEHQGEAGAGLVKIVLNGDFGVKGVHLDEALLKEDKDIIEDLLAAAFNDAARKVEDARQKELPDLGKGFDLPKDFKFPF